MNDINKSPLSLKTLGNTLLPSMHLMVLMLILSLLVNILLFRSANILELNIKGKDLLPLGHKVPVHIVFANIDKKQVQINLAANNLFTMFYFFNLDTNKKESRHRLNVNNVKSLTSTTKNRVTIIGFAVDAKDINDIGRYISTEHLEFPIYGVENSIREMFKIYHPNSLPESIVVNSDGTVVKRWHGEYSGDLRFEIEDYFQIKLPGISMTTENSKA